MNSSRGIQLAETGVEEAMWAITNGTWTGWTVTSSSATKTMSPSFSFEGGVTGQVTLKVTTLPVSSSFATPLDTSQSYAVTSSGKVTLGDGTSITRTLTAYVKGSQQIFTNAIGSTDTAGSITFASGGTVDSYDSSVGNYGAGNKTYAAVISAPSVDIGTAQISGYIAANSFQKQNSAKVVGPTTPVGTNIDNSRVSDLVKQATQDPVTLTGGSYLYDPNNGSSMLQSSVTLNSSGIYRLDYVNLGNGAVLTINAPVILKVRYWVQTQGTGQIRVTSSGSLQIQIDENNGYGIYLQGGGIVNDSLKPQNVSVLVGRTYSGTSQSVVSTTNPFYGTMYLPNDTVSVNSNFSMYGAMAAKSVSFATGTSPNIHFDTHLLSTSVSGFSSSIMFGVTQLNE